MLEDQYASKKAINCGRAWMQWLKSTYTGNLQRYIDNIQMLLMALETVNIKIQKKLQEFHENLTSQQESNPSIPASTLLCESSHPHKITYFFSHGKHNPMCTTHTREKCFSEDPNISGLSDEKIKEEI
ncbi:hypothetical protein O181_012827 [Austropuccinia psidii MF-1]|uniref:Uncharacterized protein n=1 Tax=Austropuccinia psidii MF-1 TaxID=1389203 RepID=A0A9Q3GND4_9BASI|nr:hypothetical protein [Austropuccinia psidii MF-1]